mgnify:CR=1 FL=1
MNPTAAYDRILERTLEAERAVLGAVLVDPTRYDDAADVLGAGDWFRQAHRLIWQAFEKLASSGQSIDGLVVTNTLTPADLDEVGTATPLLDWCSLRHETQYTRLFRS